MKNFYEKVYDIVAQIPKGKVTTYGCIAMRLGNIRLSRLVGNALHANTDPVNVPCHRVVNREGKLHRCMFSEALTFKRNGLKMRALRLTAIELI